MIRTSLVFGLALAAAPVLSGCPAANQSKELTDKDKKVTAPVEAHEHEHGPHGGEIIELGDNHGEINLESDRKVTLYILDGKVKDAVPLAETTVVLALKNGADVTKIDLKPMPLEGEKDGKSSRYQSEAPAPEAFKDVHDLKGDVTVTTAGKATTETLGGH